jgi:stearoyl-CoA desaturase (delta-9 desaturase)
MGWVYNETYIGHNYKNCADLTRYKELRVIDRLFWLPMLLSFIACYWLGAYLEKTQPQLGTNGLQVLIWGGFLRVLFPLHIMAWINYFSHSTYHKWGYRNFDSPDTSRNIWFLGILGAGVGWHNNHHKHGRYASTRVMWWEVDASAGLIWCLEKLGIVWNVRWIPESYREEAKAYRARVAAEGKEPDPRLPTYSTSRNGKNQEEEAYEGKMEERAAS